MVTIYLPLLTAEIAPEIPAFPILMDSFLCQVTHVETVCVAYVQNSCHSELLTTFLNDLFDFYNEGGRFFLILFTYIYKH